MDIAQETVGAVQVLAPRGRLDTDSAADFELAVQDLLAANALHYVVDLAGISYVSSAGLRVLLMLGKSVDGKGSLRIAGLNPQVKQVFDIAGFTKLFAIHADRAAALAGHPHADAAAAPRKPAAEPAAKPAREERVREERPAAIPPAASKPAPVAAPVAKAPIPAAVPPTPAKAPVLPAEPEKPSVATLAAELMGARARPAATPVDAAAQETARRAAGLLGTADPPVAAKPPARSKAPAIPPAAPEPRIATAPAAAREPAPPARPTSTKPGFFARLFGRKS